MKFEIGDKVIVKSTIGGTNGVCEVTEISQRCRLSDGAWRYSDQLELWNPKTDLEGGYKMKEFEISMVKKYETKDGREVEIIAVRPELMYPVIGIIKCNSHGISDFVGTWKMDGTVKNHGDDLNLIEINPYADFKIDDKVLVKDTNDKRWIKAHFAHIGDDKKYLFNVFYGGSSSFTADSECDTQCYEQCVKWEDRTDDVVI